MIKKTGSEKKKRGVCSFGELVLSHLFTAKTYLVPVWTGPRTALKNDTQIELIEAAVAKRLRKNQKRLAGLV